MGFDARYARLQAIHERQSAAMADEGDLAWDQMLGLKERIGDGRLTPEQLLAEVQFPPTSDRIVPVARGDVREILYDAPHYQMRVKFVFPSTAPPPKGTFWGEKAGRATTLPARYAGQKLRGPVPLVQLARMPVEARIGEAAQRLAPWVRGWPVPLCLAPWVGLLSWWMADRARRPWSGFALASWSAGCTLVFLGAPAYRLTLGGLFSNDHLLWGVLMLAGTIATLALGRRVRRVDPLTCSGCGYSLAGNTTGKCPECGAGLSLRASNLLAATGE